MVENAVRVVTYYIDIKPFIVNIDNDCAVVAHAYLHTDSSAENDRFIIDNEVKLSGDIHVNIKYGETYNILAGKEFWLKLVDTTFNEATCPKISNEKFCESYKKLYPEVESIGEVYDCVGVDDSTYIYIRAKNKRYDFGTNNCVTLYIGNDNRTICYRTNKFSCTVY